MSATYTPHFLKQLDSSVIKADPSLKRIEKVLIDLNENRYNDGLTNLILLSLSEYGKKYLFNYSVSKVKRYLQDLEVPEEVVPVVGWG